MRESPPERGMQRVLGRIPGSEPGPTVLFVAGIHGNEPSGVRALERVFARIRQAGIRPRGRIAGYAGNLQALGESQRFLGQDLNRMFRRAAGDAVRSGAPPVPALPEDREFRELLGLLHEEFDRAQGSVVVLDLHTASSDTTPFFVLGDTLRNRRFGRRYGAPIVLGVEEELTGTLMEYVTGIGHVSMVFEAGQHDSPVSADNHESAIWLTLVFAGSLEPAQVPDYEMHRKRLAAARRGMPEILEIHSRHAISPEDGFVMRPGFRNFQRLKRGDVVADDRNGEVRVAADCLLFLPLYQGLGADGFFLARSVNPLWLKISTWLREMGAARLAPLLPGVRAHPELAATLLVNRKIARFFAPEIFHLLGFRVRTVGGDTLEVQRRLD